MKKLYPFYNYLLIFTLALIYSSCSRQKEVKDILSQAENVVEQYPDSALVLLDSIQNPEELSKGYQAKYMLLSVEAKYKSEKDISSDTLIFSARDYFKKSKDIKHWALATFYSGRVLESLQKSKEALNAFLEAESIAIPTQDSSLIGFIQYNIGTAFYQKELYDDAIVKFKQASENFARQKKDYEKEIMSLDFIGSNFMIKNCIDSALFYYNKALSEATIANDSTERANVLQNMGVSFIELGRNDDAKAKLIEAKQFCKDSILMATIDLNLARTYFNSHSLDSAVYYIARSNGLAQKTDDKTLQASVFYYWTQIDEEKGNYKESLEHFKKYTGLLASIVEENQKANFLDVQRKYNFELIRRANHELLIEKQKYLILFLTISLVSLIFAFIVFRKKKKEKDAILLAKQEIYHLKNIISTYDSVPMNSNEEDKKTISAKNQKIREIMAEQFGILKRILLLEDALSTEEKDKSRDVLKRVYTIFYGSSDRYNWKALNEAINDLYDGFADKLHAIAPHLNNFEIQVCCLTKAGLNNTEIASVLNTTSNAIQLRKTHIRKAMQLQEQTNFLKELDKKVKES